MNRKKINEYLQAFYPHDQNVSLLDGFDEALIGFAYSPNGLVAIYSECLCIEILMNDMDKFEAVEYFDYHITKNLEEMNNKRPIILQDIGFPRAGIEDYEQD